MLNRSLSDQVLRPPFTQPTTNEPREAQDVDANTTFGDARRPSAGWLRNPAWIGTLFSIHASRKFSFLNADGGVNPPKFYYSHEEIDAAFRASGVERPPRYTQPDIPVAPSQLINGVNLAMGATAGTCRPSPLSQIILINLTGMPPATQYDILSSRVSPTPVPANNHYRTAGPLGNSIGNEPSVSGM